VTNAELRQLAADGALGNPRWPALQRRAATLYGSNLLLLSVVWAMVFKPTCDRGADSQPTAIPPRTSSSAQEGPCHLL